MRPRTPKPVMMVVLWILTLCTPGLAQDRQFVLQADPALIEAGLMQHLVPRFSMKTSTRITLTEDDGTDGSADASLTTRQRADARPVIADADTVWFFDLQGDNAHAARFGDWLRSDIGQRTLAAFAPDGAARFGPPPDRAPEAVADFAPRDVSAGIRLSLVHCGRCHVIGPQNRQNGIGSTPSFAMLRGLANWQARFESFYVLNPHPAFTQIDTVTPAFDPARPSPIHPVMMTLDDLDEIMAYVTRIAPADLGAPIRHQ